KVGRWPVIREGTDVTLVSMGAAMRVALEGADLLTQQGISVQLLNASWLKPVDEEFIVELISKTKGVVTIEDHNVKGGIGTLVCEILSKHHPERMLLDQKRYFDFFF
ncbi:hypothetical protein IID10_06150, partial [candidate division KSB1 bacterium]|nr:hypothetical protein [candidate division KSB1 bacterium]